MIKNIALLLPFQREGYYNFYRAFDVQLDGVRCGIYLLKDTTLSLDDGIVLLDAVIAGKLDASQLKDIKLLKPIEEWEKVKKAETTAK